VRGYWRKQDCVQIQKRRDTVEAFAANRPLYEACRNSTPLKSRNHAVWWKQVHFSQNDENENVPTNCSFKKKNCRPDRLSPAKSSQLNKHPRGGEAVCQNGNSLCSRDRFPMGMR
jgi:hypothetical protein